MRVTRGRIIKNTILIVFGIIMFCATIAMSIFWEDFNGGIGFILCFPGLLSLTHGIVDMDEMNDPSATTGGSN